MLQLLHLVRETVGRQCVNPSCERRSRRIVEEAVICPGCGERLVSKQRTNWRVVGPLLGVLVVALLGTLYLTHEIAKRHAAAREREVLSQAEARFQGALRGATRDEVEAVAASIQAELRLSDPQRQRMVAASRDRIERLPRALTSEREQRLESLVRTVYQDGRVLPVEKASLDRFAREERLAPATVLAFENRVRERLEASQRSVSRAQAYVRQGLYAEAREEFIRATESDPGNAMAWANLGAANAQIGRTEEARDCYQKALGLDPGNWPAHFNLALLLERNGDRNAAFEHFTRALSSLDARSPGERQALMDNLLHDPSLSELRKDQRFTTLLSTALPAAQGLESR